MADNIFNIYRVILLVWFLKAAEGEYCDNGIYCSNGCCGYSSTYCCSSSSYSSTTVYSDVGLIVGVVFGSIAFLLIVASVIVAVCCCCRKSRAQHGLVIQTTYPATTVQGGPVSSPGYGQAAYVNGAVSAQIQTANIQPGPTQTWNTQTTVNERLP